MKKKVNLVFAAVVLVLLSAFLGVEGAEAFKQEDVDKLLKTKQCPNCDLSGANLNGADLGWADLNGANLSDAKLSYAVWTDGSKCKAGSIGQCVK